MKHPERLALLLSLAAVTAAYLVAGGVFERVPHIEDEMAFAWQAQVFAQGHLSLASPPAPKSMMVPFVVDYRGARFAKYPPGWPMMLALGLLLGARGAVNPFFAGLAVWLTYRMGSKLFSPRIGLLAAILTLTSPFFLINSGSLLSHAWSLVLSLSFALAWLDTFRSSIHEEHTVRAANTGGTPAVSPRRAGSRGPNGVRDGEMHEEKETHGTWRAWAHRAAPAWLTVSVAGSSLGMLALTRPLTAVGVGLPFMIHGLVLLARGDRHVRLRVLVIGLLAACIGGLVFAWQYAATGDALLNPYTLWWKYDKVGFGGGFGRQPGGHSLHWAIVNLVSSLHTGERDLFGWGNISWLFLPFGLWGARRVRSAWLPISVFPALVLVYMSYWIGSNLFGPRYYYEGLYSLTLTSAVGIAWLANEVAGSGWLRWMRTATALLVIFLIAFNLTVYLPHRLGGMRGLYGITRSMLEPFETPEARALAPALIIVRYQKAWTEYGGLLELENADLTSPFIFAISRSSSDRALARLFPSRRILYYYPDEPGKFYSSPR